MTQPVQPTPDTPNPETGPVGIPEPTGAPLPGFKGPLDMPGIPTGPDRASRAYRDAKIEAGVEEEEWGSGEETSRPRTTPTTGPSTGDGEWDEANPWQGAGSDARVKLGGAKTLAPFLEELLGGAGVAANGRAADRGGHPDQWLLDERDVTIADPLARVIERVLPAAVLLDPSLNDVLNAALILGRYAMKQFNLATIWHRHKRQTIDAQATPEPVA